MGENLGEGFCYPGGFLGILPDLGLGICGIFVAFVEFFCQLFWFNFRVFGVFWLLLNFWEFFGAFLVFGGVCSKFRFKLGFTPYRTRPQWNTGMHFWQTGLKLGLNWF